jgi:hypothetical protein
MTRHGHAHVPLGREWLPGGTVTRATLPPFGDHDAGELQLWFHVKRGACEDWDSARGHNYRFTIGDVAPYSEIRPIIAHTCGGCHGSAFDGIDAVRQRRDTMLRVITSGRMPRGNPEWRDSADGRKVIDFLEQSPELAP